MPPASPGSGTRSPGGADASRDKGNIIVHTRQIDIESTHPQELISISDEVRGIVEASGLANGLCTVFCPHTTGGLTLNSPLDPTTAQDLQEELDRLVPTRTNFHHQFDTPADAAAHVKGALVGHSVTVPVVDGQLGLGWSQGIFFLRVRRAAVAASPRLPARPCLNVHGPSLRRPRNRR